MLTLVSPKTWYEREPTRAEGEDERDGGGERWRDERQQDHRVERALAPARQVAAHGEQREGEAERGAGGADQDGEQQAVHERRAMGPVTEQAAHGLERRAAVPE